MKQKQTQTTRWHLMTGGLILCYGVVIVACLTLRPLWLDEVVQLVHTTAPSVRALVHEIPYDIGAAPLAYLTQYPLAHAAGASRFWSRFPSAVSSVLACWALVLFCRELEIPRRASLASLAIFLLIPTQFRYAIEGRPYAEALWLCVVSLVLLLRFLRTARIPWLCLLVVAGIAAIYTHPYAILPSVGMAAWSAFFGYRQRRWKPPLAALVGLAIATLSFVPWYFYSWPTWQADEALGGIPKFQWTAGLAQDVFKGISGGSFLCSLSFVALAIAGVSAGRISRDRRMLLLFGAVCVLAAVLTADALRGYFFAGRQLLFALPAMVVLAGLGLCRCFERRTWAGILLGAVFCGASLKNDIGIAGTRTEDWQIAAQTLERVSGEGYCLTFVRQELGGAALYDVFVPGLRSHQCPNTLEEPRRALVWHKYLRTEDVLKTESPLRAAGYRPGRRIEVGGTTIQYWDRAPL